MTGKHKCDVCAESCGGLASLVWFLGTRALRCRACGKVTCETCANRANPGRLVNRCPHCQGALDLILA